MNTSFGMITYVLFIFSCGNNFSSQYKRPDRDNSVTFYPQHLEDRCKHEFNKMTIDPYPGIQRNHKSKGLECWGYFWPQTVTSIRNKLISTKKGNFVQNSENSISSEFTRTLIFLGLCQNFQKSKGFTLDLSQLSLRPNYSSNHAKSCTHFRKQIQNIFTQNFSDNPNFSL